MASRKFKQYALFIIGAFFLSHILSILWVFTFYFDPAPDTMWVDYIYQKKQAYARSISGPKIVIVAGSSGHYGISAAQIEDHFKIPTVNFHSHADLTDLYFYESTKNLNPGDLVIMAPEYQLYFCDDIMTRTKADYIVNYDKNVLLNTCPLKKNLRF